jgi:genome maintenance exonuclease 1
MAVKDEARFYKIHGYEWPSVTTVLQVVNKPALGPWYAKQERQAFETAMVNLAADTTRILTPDALLDAVIEAVKGVKAADKARQAAADIGTAAHGMIEWITLRLLGMNAGPEPTIPDAAMVAVESWKEWAASVDFRPLHVEPVVYHAEHGYAGRADVIAKIRGVVTLADYKTGRAVYAEAHLQNIAYRHAAASIGMPSDAGLILRLPKTLADPAFEAVTVLDAPLDDFLAALRLWRWQRRMDGKPVGTMNAGTAVPA